MPESPSIFSSRTLHGRSISSTLWPWLCACLPWWLLWSSYCQFTTLFGPAWQASSLVIVLHVYQMNIPMGITWWSCGVCPEHVNCPLQHATGTSSVFFFFFLCQCHTHSQSVCSVCGCGCHLFFSCVCQCVYTFSRFLLLLTVLLYYYLHIYMLFLITPFSLSLPLRTPLEFFCFLGGCSPPPLCKGNNCC